MGALATKTGLNLMIEYLDVCNAASEAHRFSLPYKPIIAAYDSFFANRQVGIDIYGKDTDEIETTVTIRLVNGRFEPVSKTEVHSSFHLKLSRHLHGGRSGTPRRIYPASGKTGLGLAKEPDGDGSSPWINSWC